jgi:hypothetical protein
MRSPLSVVLFSGAAAFACDDAARGHSAGSKASDAMPAGGALSDAERRLGELTSGKSDFVNPFAGELTPVRRGEYLVRHVAACMECHTPRLPGLEFDEEHLLSGVENLFDLARDEAGIGAIHSRNLTPDEATGLGSWTDDEIKAAFTRGVSRDGDPLHPMMPYVAFANMNEEDADAIVTYLRSIPAVRHDVPVREPLPFEPSSPASPFPPELVPEPTLAASDPDYERAIHGKYLASAVAPCLFCHTEEARSGAPDPLLLDKPFMGRRAWVPVPLGESAGPDVGTILSRNLTPADNGLARWSPQQIADGIRFGRDPEGRDLCHPMPYGPGGSFGLMLEEDALAIGVYFKSIEPRDNGEFESCCKVCHGTNASGCGSGLSGSCLSP